MREDKEYGSNKVLIILFYKPPFVVFSTSDLCRLRPPVVVAIDEITEGIKSPGFWNSNSGSVKSASYGSPNNFDRKLRSSLRQVNKSISLCEVIYLLPWADCCLQSFQKGHRQHGIFRIHYPQSQVGHGKSWNEIKGIYSVWWSMRSDALQW